MLQRGLVISCPIEISAAGGLLLRSNQLDPQELRFSLLFWDKLDFPENRAINIGLDNDAQFLRSAGVLTRTIVPVSAGELTRVFAQAHVTAFRTLDQKEPGVWSLATGANSISFPPEEMEPGRGVLVTLHRAIAVPDKDVPLQDILDFRSKRSDELLSLRTHLEDTYERVISAGDAELALNREVDRLERALSDYMKAAHESRIKFRLVDFDASLNVAQLIPPMLVAGLGYTQGLPLLASLTAGAAAAALSVKIGPSLKRREASPTPFKYISSYHRELF